MPEGNLPWARFFPGALPAQRNVHLYPMPLSETFWRTYAEPLFDFVCWGKALVFMMILFESSYGRDHVAWLLRSALQRVVVDPNGDPIVY